jgi:hypothetical protein
MYLAFTKFTLAHGWDRIGNENQDLNQHIGSTEFPKYKNFNA